MFVVFPRLMTHGVSAQQALSLRLSSTQTHIGILHRMSLITTAMSAAYSIATRVPESKYS
jgi:hypothetical protein